MIFIQKLQVYSMCLNLRLTRLFFPLELKTYYLVFYTTFPFLYVSSLYIVTKNQLRNLC